MADCSSPKVPMCGGSGPNATTNRVVSGQGNNTQTFNKSRLITASVGGYNIVLQSRARTYNMNTQVNWQKNGFFCYYDSTLNLVDCFSESGSSGGSVSESYQCVDTTLAYLDLRYGLALATEIDSSISFSPSRTGLAAFSSGYGVLYYFKMVMESVFINNTITYYAVYGGKQHVLGSNTTRNQIYSGTNPLILLGAQPPSAYVPFDADILNYGFYSYYCGNQPQGVHSIEHDGGDDYYFTDWMRLCGSSNQVQDQNDAELRYQTFYNFNGVSAPGTYTPSPQPIVPQPNINFDATPQGSIKQDTNGNIAYSWTVGGKTYNFITNAYLQTLTQVPGNNAKFYPIGLV